MNEGSESRRICDQFGRIGKYKRLPTPGVNRLDLLCTGSVAGQCIREIALRPIMSLVRPDESHDQDHDESYRDHIGNSYPGEI
jgi:hypothetical protein